MMGPLLLEQFSSILGEFARGGGGGSGGGGGGGGSAGGGSSGSSNGASVFYFVGLVGYVPMYGLGKLLSLGQYKSSHWVLLQITGWVVTAIIAAALLICIPLLGLSSLGVYVFVPIVIAVGAVLGMWTGMYSVFTKLKQSRRVLTALRAAEKKDYSWTEKKLKNYAEGIFYKFQRDWSTFNAESMGRYLTPRYQSHINLMLQALAGAHRANTVLAPQILKSVITNVTDSEDNNKDTFVIGFNATANDQLIDTRGNGLLFQDNSLFTEYWRFIRRGNDWLFDGIQQATMDSSRLRSDIEQFAAEEGMYYSPDWGWLLLPKDGYLFAKGSFGVSDINNHVIGYVNNVLTQLYTYVPINNSQNATDRYLVIQTNVPKNYGRILVKRRSKFINWPVAGLSKIKMEWGEFNDLYDVYASDTEKATSFELLNPAFMAHLRDLPFEVSIEVVDNVVYIFTKAQSDISIYKGLYDILLKAHKEMKL